MDDDNWLEAEVLTCPNCGAKLFAVVHSPFYDEEWLYCNRCPKVVEVSSHDSIFRDRRDLFPPTQTPEEKMSTIERQLRSCDCGGRFELGAPRRCFACAAEVPSAAWKDLSPYTGCEDGARELTDADQAIYDQYLSDFHRSENLWKYDDDVASGTSLGE